MRAVFLDKDGTLIEDVPYNVDPAQIRLLPGALEGLAALHAANLYVIRANPENGSAALAAQIANVIGFAKSSWSSL